jgi:hypothetical protein
MMSQLPFDPSKAVTFDLTHGLVRRVGSAPSSLLVAADAVLALAGAAGPEAAGRFAGAVGAAIGHRVAGRLVDGVGSAPVEEVVEHLAGEIAVSGLGALSLERWGRAAVVVVDQSPLGASGDALLETILATAIGGAAGRPVAAALLGRDGARARFLLGSRAAADRVRAWIAEGVSWPDAVVRLHAPTSAPVGGLEGAT